MIQSVAVDRTVGELQHIRVALHQVLASYGLATAIDSSLRLPTMNSADCVSEIPASCHFDLMSSSRVVTSEAVTSRHLLTMST